MINHIKNNVQRNVIYRKVNMNDLNSRAAAMSYYLLLSIFPFLIFMINLIGYIPIIHINRFIGTYEGLLPNVEYVTVQAIIESAINDRNISLTVFSFIFTLWSSSRAVRVFIRGINKSYNIRETRSFFKLITLSFYFTIEIIVLIISTLVLLIYGEKIGYFIFNLIGLSKIFIPIWNICRYSCGILAIICILSSLYRYAPNKKMSISEVLPGAILSIFGWLLISFIFSFYANNYANYQVIYGSIGGIIALLTWFYLNSWVILIGCEINAFIYYKKIQINAYNGGEYNG